MTSCLQKLINLDDLEEFVHSSVNYMLGIPSVDYLSQLNWPEEEIESAKKSLNSVLCASAMTEDISEIEKSLKTHLHNLEESQQKCVFDCFQVRRMEIMKHIIRNLNSHKTPLLNDFNWRMKWALGNSSLAAHKEPFLQLDLIFKQGNENKSITIELNEKELDTVIFSLESVRDKIDQY